MKVLAILAKSAKDKGSKIGAKFITKWQSGENLFTLDHIRDTPFRGDNFTWQTLDTLVNLAIDNVKDQALNKFRINSKNANITSIMLALGIPVSDFALVTGTSIWRRMSSDEFKNFDGGLSALSKQFYGEGLWKALRDAEKKGEPLYTTVLSFEVLDKFLTYEKT